MQINTGCTQGLRGAEKVKKYILVSPCLNLPKKKALTHYGMIEDPFRGGQISNVLYIRITLILPPDHFNTKSSKIIHL